MEPTPPVHTLGITDVFSESNRIMKVSYSHFLALSLFFLPLSFFLIITPTLNHLSSSHHKILVYYLLYILTAYTLALCAIATITYITYHAFFGEQVNFSSSLKSLTYSFFPIVSTAVVAHVLLLLISICFLMFVGGILMLAQNLGFVIDYNSVWLSAVVGVALMVIIMYFYVKWSLAFVVVVVESKWGLAPLRRSSYLVRGMRSVSLLVILYFGICGALMVSGFWSNVYVLSSWSFLVILAMLNLLSIMIYLVWITTANTVLYVYCKALHGELAIDINEGLVPEYVNLPSNDEKVVVIA